VRSSMSPSVHPPYADDRSGSIEKEKRRRRHPALSLEKLRGKADYLSHQLHVY
jgi:hypothetical protein